MTKLEELTALLVNEINDFNKDVEKLEKINAHLKTTKIKMDVSEYKSIIEEHQQEMQSHLNMLKGFENRFDSKIKQAKIYPNWAVGVFIMTVLFGVGSIILWLI
jgi:vancomycin resistance protein YoaR